MIRRTFLCLSLLMVGLDGISAQQPVTADPWFGPSPRPRDFRPALLPWNTFSVEFPNGWELVRGYGIILVTATERMRGNVPGAAIVVEHNALVEPLGPQEIDTKLAELELEDVIKVREPGGQNFRSEAKEVNKRRFVFIQYSRPGFSGTDRVSVYVMPVGRVMYRLICIAPEKEVARYQPMCAHVANSFKPAANP
jgi:hypothetical protein